MADVRVRPHPLTEAGGIVRRVGGAVPRPAPSAHRRGVRERKPGADPRCLGRSAPAQPGPAERGADESSPCRDEGRRARRFDGGRRWIDRPLRLAGDPRSDPLRGPGAASARRARGRDGSARRKPAARGAHVRTAVDEACRSDVTENIRASAPERDRLTAGLVLARAILADPIRAGDAVWRHLTYFHASVVRPLLEHSPDAEREQVLRWAGALGGAAVLMELAEAAMDAGMSDDVVHDLMTLADLVAGTVPEGDLPGASRGEVLVGGPGGEFVVLTVDEQGDPRWSSALEATERPAVEAAVDAVLSAYPSREPAAESWPFMPHVRWPSPVALSEAATDLPMALWLLSEIFGLGPSPLVSAGRYDGTNFQPLSPSELDPRVDAARAVRRDLLVPTATGWQCHPGDGSPPRNFPAPRTLDGAASIVWGEQWSQKKRDAHKQELDLLGWHFVDWSRTPEDQPIPDCTISQVRQLERHFLDKSGPGTVAMLGGTRHSGRSVIVRRLAAGLARRKRPWTVQVITGATRELPDRHSALRIADHAVSAAAHPADQSGRWLLVFEDLQPTGDGNASEVLRFVAEQLRITVLGVLEYAENSSVDWDTDNAYVATAVVGQEARRRFVEDLAAADTSLDPDPALAALNSGVPVDLRMLTRLMSGDADLASRRSARFREMWQEDREALVFTAAVSLVSGDVEEQRLDTISDDDRWLFGIGPGRGPGTLRMTSANDCVAMLALQAAEDRPAGRGEPRWKAINTVLTQHLGPDLDRLLRAGDKLAVERLHGVRLYHQSACRSLLKAAGEDGSLDEWVLTAPLLSVARMVELSDLMPDRTAQKVVTQMATRACRGSTQFPPDQLLALMRACQQVEYLLAGDVIDELVAWFINGVSQAFDEVEGRPDERFAMLSALERLNRDDATGLVAERALDVLDGLAVRVEDYRLVRRVDQLYRRAARKTWHEAPYFPVDQEEPVQQLLERKPDSADGIGVLFEAMNLRLSLVDHDWEITFPAYKTALNQAFRSATASELVLGLQGIRAPIPQFGTWLLTKWKEFPDLVRELLITQAGATDTAALIHAVARANVYTAYRILNDGPSGMLVRVLARRAGEARDAKGIGQLLSAARSVEDLFRESGSVFSTEMAEAVGADRIIELLNYDPRTSVRYHVIKGVWDAQASYRSEVLSDALSVVVDAVRRGRKQWGPEIALRLVSEPHLGAVALSELRNKLRRQDLLSGMTSATTAHARAVFHRLGRVVHPDLPALFLQQWELTPFVEGLATSSPTAALEVCAEVARTLTDADVPAVGREIAAATGGADQWARRLRMVRNEEAFVQAIRHLTAIDRATAGDTLDRLRDTPSHVTIGGRVADILMARLRRALLGEPTCAPAMLRAIHDVRPQLARDLLADVSADQHATFVFRGEIQQIQNPVTQSTAARDLLSVGVTREFGSAWIEPVYRVRIQGLPRFSSPRAITALLRMISAWDAGWGLAAAGEVNVQRVVGRLAFAGSTDVVDAIELARTMAALGNTAGAQRLLEELAGHDIARLAERLDVASLCALVDVLGEMIPEAVPRFSRALATALQTLVGQLVVSDERAHWLQAGRACRILNQAGAPSASVGEPPIAPNVAYAPAVAWAATGLNQPGWGADALGRAATRLTSLRSTPDATDLACLLSATGQGCAPELRRSRTDWDVGQAPLWLLRILYAEEATDPYLSSVLSACEPAIRERVNADINRPLWDASRLRLMLDARNFLRSRPGSQTPGDRAIE
ncbi:hypothetical protein E1286_34180 [Nonomuraea terrae]|uniref:Uncharacterized protein n=1 Tax=Nonomuraea terrae TaxID=2530383 RepID=A0A4V2YK31_9ACTN|nr:hypothetical protein [Nonomuraea terrae]TDD40717.1 hypothetical protein E1286_34180 [Nonomuraea terrae]